MTARAKVQAAPVGLREYARHRKELGLTGRSHTAVRRAIESGRLRGSVSRDSRGRPRIDVAKADAEWAKNTDPSQTRPDPPAVQAATAAEPLPELHTPDGQAVMFPEAMPQPEEGSPDTSSSGYRQAAAIRQAWLARGAELDVLERQGKLVRIEEVEAKAYALGRNVRDAVLRIPNRVVGQLRGAADDHDARVLLEAELVQALEALADGAV